MYSSQNQLPRSTLLRLGRLISQCAGIAASFATPSWFIRASYIRFVGGPKRLVDVRSRIGCEAVVVAVVHRSARCAAGTADEIAGDGDVPHPAIGNARRMQVPHPAQQHAVMIEAVENHTPEVIIIDEIGTEEEAQAARTIAERGVMLIGTAHGNALDNLLKNPVLVDLVGGIETVTLGDDEARRRGTQKTVLERANSPTFDICVEILDRQTLAVHRNVSEAVDQLLRGWKIHPEI